MDLFSKFRARHFQNNPTEPLSHRRHFPFKRVERKFKKIARTRIKRETEKDVIDFLRFDFGNYTFPIFNFADICAVVATALIILLVIFQNKMMDAYLSLFELKGNKNDRKA